MTQLDDLQNFTNANMPLRRIFRQFGDADVAYDGDPNAGAAPLILQVAPVGTYYLRGTPSILYEKLTAGATTWSVVGSAGAGLTREDITIPVDYASSVDPPAGMVFSTQQEVDDALAGTPGFKHLNAVFSALPVANHTVTIDVAAGVHRPEVGASKAWTILTLIGSGAITVKGPDESLWPAVVASAPITGVQLGANDPYVDCAAATFPNDGSLKGKHARFSTGQLTLINDHTDSRLNVMDVLSPDPTGGTVEVVEPAAELRNSQDDVATSAMSGCLRFAHGALDSSNRSTFENLIVDSFDANFAINFKVTGCIHRFKKCQLRMQGGNGLNVRGGFLWLDDTSLVGDPPLSGTSKTDTILQVEQASRALIRDSYFLGGEDGIICEQSSLMEVGSVVFDEVGSASVGAPAINIQGSFLESSDFDDSKTTEIRNTDVGIIAENSVFGNASNSGFGILFKSCSSDCMVIGSGNIFNMGTIGAGLGDGGGNLGVGIRVTGSHNSLDLPSVTNVTGALGDIDLEGVVGTYADLVADSPVTTTRFNKISKA